MIESQTNQVLIIGIAGGSGSGKTTILKQLRSRFNKDELCLLSLDDYYVPREQQVTDDNGIKNFDLPTSIDAVELYNDLQLLIKGEVVEREEYTFNNESQVPLQLQFQPAPIIIVEGIFIYHYEDIRNALDVKVFIDADHEIKLNRRLVRDRDERNYPESDVRYRYKNHVTPAFKSYVEPYKSICDIIINNNKSYEVGLDMLVSFIEKRLTAIA